MHASSGPFTDPRWLLAPLLLLALGQVACGPPTAREILGKAQADPSAENVQALDGVLEDDSLSDSERGEAVRILVEHAKDPNDAVRKVNRFLDKAGEAEVRLGYDLITEAWDGSDPVPPKLEVDRFLPLIVDAEVGMDVARWIGTHSLLKTATASKLFPMIFDSSTRKEATAAMVALGDVGAWAETPEAKKAIADTVEKATNDDVAQVLAGLSRTDPIVPASGAIGSAIIRRVVESGGLASADGAFIGVMLNLLVKAPDVGTAQDRFLEITRTNPDVAAPVAVAVLQEGVNAERDVAGSVVVTLLGSDNPEDVALADTIISVMKKEVAPLLLHSLLTAPRLPMARTATYIGHLKRWKAYALTGPAKVLVTDAESEPQAGVEVLLCREVIAAKMPEATLDFDDEEEGDDDEGKKKPKPKPKPKKKDVPDVEEPKMNGCIKKSATTDKEGIVAFENVEIGIWYAVTKTGKKWSTETVTTKDKDSEIVEPAWRCELAPETGCEIGAVVR